MRNLNCLMDHIQFLTFKITLNLSSKNTKLWLKIHLFKFTPIKPKTKLFIIFRNNETIKEYKKNVDQDEDGEDVPKLESVLVVLVHCNLVNNSYQKVSKVLFTFLPKKQFGQLITISLHLLTMLKTTSAEFQSI